MQTRITSEVYPFHTGTAPNLYSDHSRPLYHVFKAPTYTGPALMQIYHLAAVLYCGNASYYSAGVVFAAVYQTIHMRSKASIRSHPLHPMLIAFPVAFLTGCLVFDILHLFVDSEAVMFWKIGGYLEIAGIATGLLAAIPGAIDYFAVIPPKSSAAKRGTKHALINITHILLFFIAWILRDNETIQRGIIIAMEAAGVVLLSIAGWMGGTLVYRNQIGVDPRYAKAGKWKEAYFEHISGPLKVAETSELESNQMKLLHINGKRIVLGRTETGFVAFDDHCTHRGGSLAGGVMICGTVQCPWHGSQFDVQTGEAKCGPAAANITTYRVTTEGGSVLLRLD